MALRARREGPAPPPPAQEETFVVLAGTLSMYVGEPPERHDVPAGGLIHIEPHTPLQTVNHGDEDLVVYAYGMPPESENAEILEPRSDRPSAAGRSVAARRTAPRALLLTQRAAHSPRFWPPTTLGWPIESPT